MTRKAKAVKGHQREAMRDAFAAHKEGSTQFTRRMAINIGDHFGMTPMQVVKHYENDGLLKRGSVEWFRYNGGITQEHMDTARADRSVQQGKGKK